ncbi:MAG TPA: hypothetical protein VJ896_04000 [Bacteroidales bacterium]|nr:hypothetical protein [Bacteroidales bacterium]
MKKLQSNIKKLTNAELLKVKGGEDSLKNSLNLLKETADRQSQNINAITRV